MKKQRLSKKKAIKRLSRALARKISGGAVGAPGDEVTSLPILVPGDEVTSLPNSAQRARK